MKTKIILMALCVMAMVGCKEHPKGGVDISTGMSFYVQNSNGDNLMSPETPNHWKALQLGQYSLNEKQEWVKDNPNGCDARPTYKFLNIPGGGYVLNVSFNTPYGSPYCVNRLEWPNGEVDVLEGRFVVSEPGLYSIVEVKINGEVMWTASSNHSNLDKNGKFPLFNKVITDKGSKISLFTDYNYQQ